MKDRDNSSRDTLSYEQMTERLIILERRTEVLQRFLESKFNETFGDFEKKFPPLCSIQESHVTEDSRNGVVEGEGSEDVVESPPILLIELGVQQLLSSPGLTLPTTAETAVQNQIANEDSHNSNTEISIVSGTLLAQTDSNDFSEKEVLLVSTTAENGSVNVSTEVLLSDIATRLSHELRQTDHVMNEEVEEDCPTTEIQNPQTSSYPIENNVVTTETPPNGEESSDAAGALNLMLIDSSEPSQVDSRSEKRRLVPEDPEKRMKVRKFSGSTAKDVDNSKIDGNGDFDVMDQADSEVDKHDNINVRNSQPEFQQRNSIIRSDNDGDQELPLTLLQCSVVIDRIAENEDFPRIPAVSGATETSVKNKDSKTQGYDDLCEGTMNETNHSEMELDDKRSEKIDDNNDKGNDNVEDDIITEIEDESTSVSLPHADHSPSTMPSLIDATNEDLNSFTAASTWSSFLGEIGLVLNDSESELATGIDVKKCDVTIFKCGNCEQVFTKKDERDRHVLRRHDKVLIESSVSGGDSNVEEDVSKTSRQKPSPEATKTRISAMRRKSKRVRPKPWLLRRPATTTGKGTQGRVKLEGRLSCESDTLEGSMSEEVNGQDSSTSAYTASTATSDDTPYSDTSEEMFEPKRKVQPSRISKRTKKPSSVFQVDFINTCSSRKLEPSDFLCKFEDCGYISSTWKERREHLRDHPMTDAIKCPDCNKIFLEKLNLEWHMKCHEPYVPPYDATGLSVRKSKIFQPRVFVERLSDKFINASQRFSSSHKISKL